jgi:O-antigen biosynthesis protein
VLTAFLHLLQPLARLWGRLNFGLTLWRRRGAPAKPEWRHLLRARKQLCTLWSEQWQAPEVWLETVEQALRRGGGIVRRGGEYDRWDLEIQGGLFGAARLLMTTEEHGAGRQLLRFRVWPRYQPAGLVLAFVFIALALAAEASRAWLADIVLVALGVLLALRAVHEAAYALAAARRAVREVEQASEAAVPTITVAEEVPGAVLAGAVNGHTNGVANEYYNGSTGNNPLDADVTSENGRHQQPEPSNGKPAALG